jgi:transcriptional regulator with XRE-family HTH domain/Zn-dependent peptidase ImmA (M78 family)
VIDVEFANGDVVEVSVPALGLDATTTFAVDPDSGTLTAEAPDGPREIDWMVIRAISDPAFAREIRERDAEEARRVGRRLRSLRERRGFSQKDVAKSLGMKAPQLAKIESGEQDLRLSTLRSVLRILGATFNDIAGPDAPELSLEELAERTGAPTGLLRAIAQKVRPREAPAQIARGFKWNLPEVLDGVAPPELGISLAFAANSEDHRRPSPVQRLARSVSEISVAAAEDVAVDLPTNARALRRALLGGAEREITLEDLIGFCWDAGIVVVPMASGPGFQAVAWYVGERPVVVLRLTRSYAAQWLFTLAHEIGHLVLGHVKSNSGVVDVDEPGRVAGDRAEDEANEFAKDVLAPGSDELFEEIRRRMPGSVAEQKKAFKGAMVSIATKAKIDPALFGFLAAYAMRDIAEDNDRWGSATNIAKKNPHGRTSVRDAYLGHVDLDRLDTADSALIDAVVLE